MQTVNLETAISYVAGAYIGIWIIFFGYLLVMGSRLSTLRKQVEALTEAVDRKKKPADTVNSG